MHVICTAQTWFGGMTWILRSRYGLILCPGLTVTVKPRNFLGSERQFGHSRRRVGCSLTDPCLPAIR
jgi:hypothetical protein